MLAWTGVTMLVAPAAGMLSDRYGGRPFMAAGLALQAVALGWLAIVMTPTVSYLSLLLPFIIAGVGMGLFFAPVANVVLSAVGWQEQGQASGANNALRELGGVFGIAVLAAIFANQGSYFTAETFMDGLTPAVWVGAVIVAIGAVVCLLIPRTAGQAVAAGQGDWSGDAQGEWAGAAGGVQGEWSPAGDAPPAT
jgi:MFS family permease